MEHYETVLYVVIGCVYIALALGKILIHA